MGVFNNSLHRTIYFWSLVLLAVVIPLSEFMMSVATLILSVNWLIEGGFKIKLKTIIGKKSILLFLSVLLIHTIWLFNTTDFHYAFNDIKVKLPLLALPLIMGSSGMLSAKQTKTLILFFVASVTASSLISTSILLGVNNHPVTTLRDISIFISHIRFSLMIDLSIFILYYYLFFSKIKILIKEKIIYLVIIVWLIIFLYLLQALSGIFIFLVVFTVLVFIEIIKLKKPYLRYSLLVFISIIVSSGIYYVYNSINKFYDIEEISKTSIKNKTKQGNFYKHNFKNKSVENGYYTYLYICEKELTKSWNKISDYKYWGKDKKGQNIKYTLIRYLTSKGLKKDAEGVENLTNYDIGNIENGIANYILVDRYNVDAIIYKTIWEVDIYLKTKNPNNNSLAQRIEYLKAAKNIIKNNFWLGIGTGDPKIEFKKQYNKMNSQLDENNKRRAHNQYVTFLLTFGIFGFILIMITLFFPYILHKNKHHLLFTIFLLIAFLSMLNEDTLETQPGITFVTYFYCLFLYAWNNRDFETNQN